MWNSDMRNIGAKKTWVRGGGQKPWSDGARPREPASHPEQGDAEPPGGRRADHPGEEACAGVQLLAGPCHHQHRDERARSDRSRTRWQWEEVALKAFLNNFHLPTFQVVSSSDRPPLHRADHLLLPERHLAREEGARAGGQAWGDGPHWTRCW